MKLFLFTVSMIVVVTVNCRIARPGPGPFPTNPFKPKPGPNCNPRDCRCQILYFAGGCYKWTAHMLKSCPKFCPQFNARCQCGIINLSRIAGGTEVNHKRKYPWQVGLETTGAYIKCGGTIINDRWILTAAHCITDQKTCKIKYTTPSTLRVAVGEHHQTKTNDDDSNTKRYRIKTYKKHPYYICKRQDYDFALLELTEAIPFNDVIRPVCLPKNNNNKYVDHMGTVTGWGRTSMTEANSLSHVLLELQVKIHANNHCGIRGTLPDHWLCAGGEEKKSFCRGDSGGPLHVVENGKYVQVGVVAHNPRTAANHPKGVYARVSKVITWITDTTKSGKIECHYN